MEINTTEEIENVIEQAAALQGMMVSEYAGTILLDHAWRVIDRHKTHRLSLRDENLFLDLLENPPAPNDLLRGAAVDFRRAVIDGSLVP